MAFNFSENTADGPDMARKASRAGPRPGTSGGGCPWAQDDDAGQFTRGPPSRAKRGNQRAETAQATQAPRAFKPAAQSDVPWATEDQSSWGQPANAIGAGLGCGRSTRTPPHEMRYDCGGATAAENMPPQYAAPVMHAAAAARKAAAAAPVPWAVDDGAAEPIMSVQQASFRSASRGGARAGAGPPAELTAQAIKAKMQGAGNPISWA